MTNLELVLNMLAEASTTEISKEKKPANLQENKEVARKGGEVANVAKKQLEKDTGKKVVTLEKDTGKKVVTSLNAKDFAKKLDKNTEK